MGKDKAQSALAVVPEQSASSLAIFEDFEFEVSGLEEVDAEDLRYAVKVWNLRGKRPDNKGLFQVDDILDTLTEQIVKELHCVFVTLHKTRDYSVFNNEKSENERICSSFDRVQGTLRMQHPVTGQPEGTVRACATCPDAQWRKNDKGKNVRDCSDVYGVISVELDESGNVLAPFMVRFKRTSLNPFKTHLQKHHIKRRQDPKTKKMVDVPLFAYPVRMRLVADDNGQFAVPLFERGDVLPREMLMALAEQAKDFREMAADVAQLAERKESQHGADGHTGSTGESFKDDDFASP